MCGRIGLILEVLLCTIFLLFLLFELAHDLVKLLTIGVLSVEVALHARTALSHFLFRKFRLFFRVHVDYGKVLNLLRIFSFLSKCRQNEISVNII